MRVAHRPYSLDDLDPMIHNSNLPFQKRMGVKKVEQYLLSELIADEKPLDAMVEIVHDTVAVIRREKRFKGSDDFELMGYDFILDRGGRPHLLETNRFPGLWFNHEVSSHFYREMIRTLYRDIRNSPPHS